MQVPEVTTYVNRTKSEQLAIATGNRVQGHFRLLARAKAPRTTPQQAAGEESVCRYANSAHASSIVVACVQGKEGKERKKKTKTLHFQWSSHSTRA